MELNYQVKLEPFEGPMDFLLDLVEKRNLFINEISLALNTEHLMKYEKK